jgi:hypothetical protein
MKMTEELRDEHNQSPRSVVCASPPRPRSPYQIPGSTLFPFALLKQSYRLHDLLQVSLGKLASGSDALAAARAVAALALLAEQEVGNSRETFSSSFLFRFCLVLNFVFP